MRQISHFRMFFLFKHIINSEDVVEFWRNAHLDTIMLWVCSIIIFFVTLKACFQFYCIISHSYGDMLSKQKQFIWVFRKLSKLLVLSSTWTNIEATALNLTTEKLFWKILLIVKNSEKNTHVNCKHRKIRGWGPHIW